MALCIPGIISMLFLHSLGTFFSQCLVVEKGANWPPFCPCVLWFLELRFDTNIWGCWSFSLFDLRWLVATCFDRHLKLRALWLGDIVSCILNLSRTSWQLFNNAFATHFNIKCSQVHYRFVSKFNISSHWSASKSWIVFIVSVWNKYRWPSIGSISVCLGITSLVVIDGHVVAWTWFQEFWICNRSC